jgi:nitrate reductase delta subunit
MSLWSDPVQPAGPFASSRKGGEQVDAVRQVKEWTRERFGLACSDTIVVAEIARAAPGFPPLQTSVTFWTGDAARHHFTVFKPVREVTGADIPPAWLKESLALSEGVACACC